MKVVDKKRFLVILLSAALFFSIYILIIPQRQFDQSVVASIPIAREVRSRFEIKIMEPEIQVILTGDIMLGRTAMTKSLDLGNPSYPFLKVADRLKEADLVFANLENPIVENCPRKFDGLIFCADPQMAEGLVFAGVDVVTLANNHSRNYGQGGIDNTLSVLGSKGILSTGLGELVTKEIKGVTFGFLGFEYIDKRPTVNDYQLVSTSNQKVDILIIGVHWGVEYRDRASDKQREIAQEMVARGADVVVGHHPHWVQDIDRIEGKPVFYSLGNFVFDQMWSEKTREGLAIKLTFKGSELVKEEMLPIYMKEWAQPEWLI